MKLHKPIVRYRYLLLVQGKKKQFANREVAVSCESGAIVNTDVSIFLSIRGIFFPGIGVGTAITFIMVLCTLGNFH